MFKWLINSLRNSTHVHLRTSEISNYTELVGILDRFMDDRLCYPLEWDDFISFDNRHPHIQVIRERIARTEPLFFSGIAAAVNEGMEILLHERNAAAALVGISARTGEVR